MALEGIRKGMHDTAHCPSCGRAMNAMVAHLGFCPQCLLALAKGSAGRASEPPRPTEITRSFGPYDLLDEIGRGGMGVVYRAWQRNLGRVVAIKMLAPGIPPSPHFISRLHAEAQTAGSLHHPNIVAVYDVGAHDGQHFLAMEYVPGESLSRAGHGHPLPSRSAAGYLQQIAEAVHHAHERGVLHRDLKPSNVIIDTNNRPRVTDFGLAKRLTAEAELTLTGQILGSPSYIAPEQVQGGKTSLDRRTDVYGLGAMLYFLLTCRPPFVADDLAHVMHLVVTADPLPPRRLNPSVPPDLETVCLKCLEKEASRRYSTAAELAEELGRFLRDEPVRARPINPAQRAQRWCRRNPALATALLAGLLALLGGLGGMSWLWRKAEVSRVRAERQSEATRSSLYAADIFAAHQGFVNHHWGMARKTLAAHVPAPGQQDLRSFEWHYLQARLRGDNAVVLSGHSNTVTALAFSPDGARLVSAARGDSLRVWDWRDRTLRRVLPCSARHIFRLAFSPSGARLAVGSSDGLELWDAESWQLIAREPFRAASVAFGPNESLLAIGQNNVPWGTEHSGPALLWDTRQGSCLARFTNSGGQVSFSPDGKFLATGSWGGQVRIWDTATGALQRNLTNAFRLLSLEFSPDGKCLAGLSWEFGPQLWSTLDWRFLGSLTGSAYRVRTLAFSPDGQRLATAGSDQTIDLWDPTTRSRQSSRQGHGDEIWSLAFSPDGQVLASGGRDEAVFLWDLSAEAPATCVTGLLASLGLPNYALSPGGSRVAAATSDGIRVYDTRGMAATGAAFAATAPIGFIPNTDHLLAVRCPDTLVRWDLRQGSVAREFTLPFPTNPDNDCRVSSSGRWMAYGDSVGRLRLIRTENGESTAEPRPHLRYVLALDFNRDETFLASSDLSNNAFVWGLPGLEPVMTLRGHKDYVRGLAVSPDGRLLATASADGTARVWRVKDGAELAVLRGHNEDVIDVAFTPDGRTLATSSYDRTVRLWHLDTGREMLALPTEARVLRIQFSSDGRLLAAICLDGTLRLWRAPPQF